jgi:hypothetical protein
MTTKLIESPDMVGIDPEEIRANPAAIVDIHEDVVRDLMKTPHATEKPRATERADAAHPRRRLCV